MEMEHNIGMGLMDQRSIIFLILLSEGIDQSMWFGETNYLHFVIFA